jgi:AraC-like DNA-binding protein/quercetin dioxygenase-like cupin family protein
MPTATVSIACDRLLAARATVFHVERRAFPAGKRMPPAVVPTARLLLIERGTATYHLDGHEMVVGPGHALLVPAMCRRWWQAGAAGLAMAWSEFTLRDRAPLDLPAAQLVLGGPERAVELATHARMAAAAGDGQRGRLLLEAELRAALARLLLHPAARPLGRAGVEVGAGDGAIRAALAWLERHYAAPTPERGLAARVGLSENHFRQRFRASVGANPRAFVLELRLHAARQLLAAGGQGVKPVAAAVGYRDALLFSRLYRRRWGVPPSADLG